MTRPITAAEVRAQQSKPRKYEEQKLHFNVRTYLNLVLPKGALWLHIANEGKRSEAEGALLKRLGMLSGCPDLLILYLGRATFIELKTPTGTVKPNQVDAMNALNSAGCETYICRSIGDVKCALHSARIPTREKDNGWIERRNLARRSAAA